MKILSKKRAVISQKHKGKENNTAAKGVKKRDLHTGTIKPAQIHNTALEINNSPPDKEI